MAHSRLYRDGFWWPNESCESRVMVQMMKTWKQTRLGSGFSSLFPDFLQAVRVKKEEKRKKNIPTQSITQMCRTPAEQFENGQRTARIEQRTVQYLVQASHRQRMALQISMAVPLFEESNGAFKQTNESQAENCLRLLSRETRSGTEHISPLLSSLSFLPCVQARSRLYRQKAA